MPGHTATKKAKKSRSALEIARKGRDKVAAELKRCNKKRMALKKRLTKKKNRVKELMRR
tara:strand:- start:307 stop:483 length:177 start_codon:yes stop_codon:yes gene_type:complete